MSTTGEGVKNVVLVHGGFVDGSGWQGVYDLLSKDGYNVSIVQNPTISLADDVAVTKRTLAAQNGPAILVGHFSHGGVDYGSRHRCEGGGPVYIAAFAPDKGESVSALIKNPPPGAGASDPAASGRLSFLDRAQFRASFAADVALTRPHSWRPRRLGSRSHTAPSLSRRGRRSRAGTSSRRTIR
jgi:hypothetical protein